MPVLKYIADTNAISDALRPGTPVVDWLDKHSGEIGITTLTLAEIRRGIELKAEGKSRRNLEKLFRQIMQDYAERTFVFDEAAAVEWGRMMAERKNQPIPCDDSLIAAIARSCDMIVVTRNGKHFPGCKTRRSLGRPTEAGKSMSRYFPKLGKAPRRSGSPSGHLEPSAETARATVVEVTSDSRAGRCPSWRSCRPWWTGWTRFSRCRGALHGRDCVRTRTLTLAVPMTSF